MKTLLLASAMIVSVASAAHANDLTINNGGRGGTGYGGAGGTGGMGGAGGSAISKAAAAAAAQSRSGSASTLTIAPGAIGSGTTGGSASVNAAPGFGLPSYGGGQCGIVGFGIAISPSGGGAIGPAWESTNCRNYYIARTMLEGGKAAEGWELMAMITPEAGKVLSAHPAAVHPIAYAPTRTFDCDKVRHDTGHGRMSDEDMAIYRSCHQ